MTLTAPTGVLSLRDALRRARKAGASVTQISRTGEWRVDVPGRSPLVISGSRKDETPELHKIVRELEAAMPTQIAQPAPALPPARPGSIRDRVVSWIDAQPTPPDGWITYPGAGAIAKATGIGQSTFVAATVNVLERQGYAELQRTEAAGGPHGRRITAIRLTGALQPIRPHSAARRPRTPAELRSVPDYRDQPIRPAPAQRIGPAPGVPDTPKLAEYAEARKLAHGHAMLRAEPSATELEAVLSEAVRLFWWIRAERR